MRSTSEIKNILLDFAQNDERVRSVLLNGSRANPNIIPDKLQDFDIVFIVQELNSFINNHFWTDFLGDKLVYQLPNEMLDADITGIGFTYLMLFKDLNRIDLTLYPQEKFNTHFKLDSLTTVWLDKDNRHLGIPESSDQDYHITKPTERLFLETCNEFWWVSTYVAKGLIRNEITYAKEMCEQIVRPMFMKMIEWKIGVENNFDVSFGKCGRLMPNYLSEAYYQKVLATYSGFDLERNWKALLLMSDLFIDLSNKVAIELNFQINIKEQNNTHEYLKKCQGKSNE